MREVVLRCRCLRSLEILYNITFQKYCIHSYSIRIVSFMYILFHFLIVHELIKILHFIKDFTLNICYQITISCCNTCNKQSKRFITCFKIVSLVQYTHGCIFQEYFTFLLWLNVLYSLKLHQLPRRSHCTSILIIYRMSCNVRKQVFSLRFIVPISLCYEMFFSISENYIEMIIVVINKNYIKIQ